MNNIELVSWVGVIRIIFIIFCFYFTLTFIEHVHKEDERIAKQSKFAAIIFLSLALFIPLIYSFVF